MSEKLADQFFRGVASLVDAEPHMVMPQEAATLDLHRRANDLERLTPRLHRELTDLASAVASLRATVVEQAELLEAMRRNIAQLNTRAADAARERDQADMRRAIERTESDGA